MSGAIVLGQEKCERTCFILTLKVKNIQTITEKIPQLVRDTVTEAYSLVNLKRPKVSENVSGYVLNPGPSRKMGALRFVDKISFDSPRRRTVEELRNTFQHKTLHHTPSQLMSAYWNWFGSYRTIATIESIEEEGSNLRIGVISFWESSSLVCCAPYEEVLSLAEKIHHNLIERMAKMKYEAKSLTKGVAVMRSLDTIRKSHLFHVQCFGRKMMYHGVISPEVLKNLPQIEIYAFEQTTWDIIRNSRFLKWSVILLNMIFSYAYSEIVKLLFGGMAQ